MTTDPLEKLDDALRFSAWANGYPFPDPDEFYATGLLPEKEIPPLPLTPPEGADEAFRELLAKYGQEVQRAFDEMYPEDARFLLWATWKAYGEALEVTARRPGSVVTVASPDSSHTFYFDTEEEAQECVARAEAAGFVATTARRDDVLSLGVWTTDQFSELLRRYREAAGE